MPLLFLLSILLIPGITRIEPIVVALFMRKRVRRKYEPSLLGHAIVIHRIAFTVILLLSSAISIAMGIIT